MSSETCQYSATKLLGLYCGDIAWIRGIANYGTLLLLLKLLGYFLVKTIEGLILNEKIEGLIWLCISITKITYTKK